MNSDFPTYSFRLEFFDERAEIVRPYILQFFTHNQEIELFDVKNKRAFLKKTNAHSLLLKDLFIGNKVLINGRQYEVVDYSDDFTRNSFGLQMESTYAMIKPGFSQFLGEAIERIYQSQLTIANMKMGYLSQEVASKFYQEHKGKPFYDTLINYMTSGPVVGIEIIGKDAIQKWRRIIGPTNLETAKRDSPNSLRAKYAKSTTENFAHGSDSPQSSQRELGIIFRNNGIQLSCILEGTSLCIIKPHAVKSGFTGSIIKRLVENEFQLTGVLQTTLDLPTSNEFLEVYRGVVEDYMDMASQMCSGPCIAIEVSKPNVFQELRTLCGPRDSLVAKKIRPGSLRAQFGTDVVLNAVHCTDLEEDAELECEYFFVLLNQ